MMTHPSAMRSALLAVTVVIGIAGSRAALVHADVDMGAAPTGVAAGNAATHGLPITWLSTMWAGNDLFWDVKVVGDYAYVAGGDSSEALRVVDISEPANPRWVGTCKSKFAWPRNLEVVDDIAYVAGTLFTIIDVTTPASPLLRAQWWAPGSWSIFDVAIQDHTAYLTSGPWLSVVDVSDPARPWFLAGVKLLSSGRGIAVKGDYAYVADWSEGLAIFEIGSQPKPAKIASCPIPGRAWDVTIMGQYALVANHDAGTQVIDISDPRHPVLVASLLTADPWGATYQVDNWGQCAVTAEYGTISVLDVSDPELPALLGHCPSRGQAYGVAVDDGHVYVANGFNFSIFEVHLPAIAASVDFLPGACPNTLGNAARELDLPGRPAAASDRPAIIPVAVLGTRAFDAHDVDPLAVLVEGVLPLSSRVADVSGSVVSMESECECTTAGPDGYVDLILHVDQEELREALGTVNEGDIRHLFVSATTRSGVPLIGGDCVTITNKPTETGFSAGTVDEPGTAEIVCRPNPFNAGTVVAFTIQDDQRVRLDILNVLGQRVETLIDADLPAGSYETPWDARRHPSGMYVARLTTAGSSTTRKLLLVK